MTATVPLDVLPVEHEHDLHLVMVGYDELGQAVHEFECASCGTVWSNEGRLSEPATTAGTREPT